MRNCAVVVVIAIAAALGACGGHKPAPAAPHPTASTTPAASDNDLPMIPPHKMDQVQHELQRKNMIVSQCLANAIDNGQVKNGTHGEVTLEIVIGTSGRTSSVKVMRTNLKDQKVVSCVVGYVTATQFPTMPRPYETSYTYSMEAN